jgi:hypothetical protein
MKLHPTPQRSKKVKKSKRGPKKTVGRGSRELIARQDERREERLARIRAGLQSATRKLSEEKQEAPNSSTVSKGGKRKGKRKAGKGNKGRKWRPGGQSVRTYSGGLPGLNKRRR